MKYYIYQVVNLFPQLIVIQIVAFLFTPEAALVFAKTFAFVNLFAVFIDWGASSIGARYLNFIKSQHEKNLYSVSYELVRVFIFLIVVSIYYSLVHYGYFEQNFELNIGVLLGLLSALVFPNWIILGTIIGKKLILFSVLYRFIGIFLLVCLSFFLNDNTKLGIYYYTFSVIGAIYFRMRLVDFSLKLLPLPLAPALKVFRNGSIFSIGSCLSYCMTGAGSILILKYFNSSDFLDFILAERYIASGRVILGLIFMKNFIMSKSIKRNLIAISARFYYGLFLLFFYIVISFCGHVFYGAHFNLYFTILFIGFSVSGFSHVWVTQNLLGNEKYLQWVLVLASAVFVYVGIVLFLLKFQVADVSFVASLATMFGELTILLIGFFMRNKNDSLQCSVL